ncbi:hypothetical protein ARMSODRAFT_983849 [Armillaria solidipes]|uniref:Uncharacterized protein n=1 Tax=Armillaria solidipes TaxID=1076256 RepID=A0A2H3B5W6_9AGAR|nr:hypothetical protein ARMSODRAFT_983849 [Armillaria solidipes]
MTDIISARVVFSLNDAEMDRMAAFVPSYFHACSLGGAHLEGELARILEHWEDHFPHLFLTLTDFRKCEEDVAYVRRKKLKKIKAYLLRTGFLTGGKVPHDPLEQGHQALRELTDLVDKLVASGSADDPSHVEPNLTPVTPPTRHQSNCQAWTCSRAHAIRSRAKPDMPFSHKHPRFTITREPPMTHVRAKLNLALTTATAPPAVTTSRTAAQTVDVAGNANVLHAWHLLLPMGRRLIVPKLLPPHRPWMIVPLRGEPQVVHQLLGRGLQSISHSYTPSSFTTFYRLLVYNLTSLAGHLYTNTTLLLTFEKNSGTLVYKHDVAAHLRQIFWYLERLGLLTTTGSCELGSTFEYLQTWNQFGALDVFLTLKNLSPHILLRNRPEILLMERSRCPPTLVIAPVHDYEHTRCANCHVSKTWKCPDITCQHTYRSIYSLESCSFTIDPGSPHDLLPFLWGFQKPGCQWGPVTCMPLTTLEMGGKHIGHLLDLYDRVYAQRRTEPLAVTWESVRNITSLHTTGFTSDIEDSTDHESERASSDSESNEEVIVWSHDKDGWAVSTPSRYKLTWSQQ